MNSYWTKRQIQQRINLLDKTIKETDTELASEYLKTAKKLKQRLESLYKDILLDKSTDNLLVSDLYKYNRYYDILKDINKELSKLNSKEVKILGRELPRMYKENLTLLNNQMGLNNKANKEQVEKAVNGIWCSDGKKRKCFKKRIIVTLLRMRD